MSGLRTDFSVTLAAVEMMGEGKAAHFGRNDGRLGLCRIIVDNA